MDGLLAFAQGCKFCIGQALAAMAYSVYFRIEDKRANDKPGLATNLCTYPARRHACRSDKTLQPLEVVIWLGGDALEPPLVDVIGWVIFGMKLGCCGCLVEELIVTLGLVGADPVTMVLAGVLLLLRWTGCWHLLKDASSVLARHWQQWPTVCTSE